ncbi:hypothetical protein [Pseudomonas sp. BBP2017]|uniref:hypothetical protein n=1 Tax=Pseudomonas sp. BBP2017 TaxID=2109731 RepID=UPI000D11E9ED|nr:hypothetical protein [Pseudomonas sp. BBP2017]PSS59081.1 hypothetical protein C6382_01575 [Pseudomonas sp. BBP2017]
MSCPRTSVCLTPLPASQATRVPRILLGGSHQPTLLRFLDGWPRRKGSATAFLIQFADTRASLDQFANDRFDLAVIQSPCAEDAAEVIGHLTRVARQGLITRG